MKIMYEHVNKRNGKWSPLLADDVYEIIKEVSGPSVAAPHIPGFEKVASFFGVPRGGVPTF